MYKARIETDSGKTVNFSFENGILFDIAPLSGVDVSLSTSQGFRQIGESVEGQGVGGITRTISGKVLNSKIQQQMLKDLPVFTSGKLYFNDSHYCEIVVKKTPMFSLKNGATRFSMQVFCIDPFWKQKNTLYYSLGGLKKLFTLPTTYNTHKFGERAGAQFINCHNPGDVKAQLKLTFSTTTQAVNYGVINQRTLEVSRFNDTLEPGELVTLWQEKGRVFATKESSGLTIDFLGYLSDDSTLFNVLPGDNILKIVADTGENDIIASAEFTPAYMGVIAS